MITYASAALQIRDADDIVVMQEATSYQTILLKTFFLVSAPCSHTCLVTHACIACTMRTHHV